MRGCSSCVVTGDLFAQTETLDRRAALTFVDSELAAIAAPAEIDAVAPGARLARDVADDLAGLMKSTPEVVKIWPAAPLDATAFSDLRLQTLFQNLIGSGHDIVLAFEPQGLDRLDAAEKLALRDAAIRHGFALAEGLPPSFGNGARAIAATSSGSLWASRDEAAGRLGSGWGFGQTAPWCASPGQSNRP